jgi:hypothetical protein
VIDEHVFFFHALVTLSKHDASERRAFSPESLCSAAIEAELETVQVIMLPPPIYAFSSASESASRYPNRRLFQGSARLRAEACQPEDWLLPCGLLEHVTVSLFHWRPTEVPVRIPRLVGELETSREAIKQSIMRIH